MNIEIKVPELGESITEVQIADWLAREGDAVTQDQDLVRVDSEKATVEIPAPAAGTLTKILIANGTTAKVGEVIGRIETGAPANGQVGKEPESKPAKTAEVPVAKKAEPVSVAKPPGAVATEKTAERAVENDISAFVEGEDLPRAGARAETPPLAPAKPAEMREAEVKPMSPLRRTVAKRLVEAQHTMAILTTFNEIDLSAVIALRKQYQEAFQAKHGVKIGFMSFFVKAAIEALKAVPQLNAEIRGNDIVYHRHFDIAVAIGTGKGLVVPPLRNAERMSFAEIEKAIADLAARANANKLKPEELEGGTFTISNGGVYGSMLSTPIINPPQSGILGLHAIQERPVARGGQVVIRPMMFVALSYDHRIVDGREAVTCLRRIKEIIEDPARLLMEI